MFDFFSNQPDNVKLAVYNKSANDYSLEFNFNKDYNIESFKRLLNQSTIYDINKNDAFNALLDNIIGKLKLLNNSNPTILLFLSENCSEFNFYLNVLKIKSLFRY